MRVAMRASTGGAVPPEARGFDFNVTSMSDCAVGGSATADAPLRPTVPKSPSHLMLMFCAPDEQP
jgi:hypothetical protein